MLASRGDLGQLLNHGGGPVKGDMTTVCNTGDGPEWLATTGASYRLIADLGSDGLWAVDAQSQSVDPAPGTTRTNSTPGPPANTTTCRSTEPRRR